MLYDALGLASLDAAAKRRAARSLLVFSGLWGAVRVTDRIPSYRCSMGVRLPGLGALGAHWRAPMAEVLPEAAGDGLVLDLRSAAYAAAWKPKGEVAARTASVRVLHAPTRKVVSHFNKATKGRIVRSLLTAGIAPKDRPGWSSRCGISATRWRSRRPRGRGRRGRWTCWWTRSTETRTGARCILRNTFCAWCTARAG